jgi:hypothetical protein
MTLGGRCPRVNVIAGWYNDTSPRHDPVYRGHRSRAVSGLAGLFSVLRRGSALRTLSGCFAEDDRFRVFEPL